MGTLQPMNRLYSNNRKHHPSPTTPWRFPVCIHMSRTNTVTCKYRQNKPINERGQVRTFGNGSWQSIDQFPNTMNGCHNGVFMLRWRSANGPVMSAVGWSTRKADFKASNPASYGFMYGTNCQMPLFKSVQKSHINNVIYEVFYYQAGV